MTKYIFAKRTMYCFKREDGPFDEEMINTLDPRFIRDGRCIPVDTPKPVIEEPVLSKEAEVKLESVKEDLMDDGKLNYSNDVEKKSPGRPKKKGFFGKKK